MLVLAYEGNSMSLLFDYISMEFTDDVRLTFDALKVSVDAGLRRGSVLDAPGLIDEGRTVIRWNGVSSGCMQRTGRF